MKKAIALLMAMLMLISAAMAETAPAGGEWQTDIRLGITREKQIMQEAGMNLKQWDEAVATKKQAALADPITREAILAAEANAAIHEEDERSSSLVRALFSAKWPTRWTPISWHTG